MTVRATNELWDALHSQHRVNIPAALRIVADNAERWMANHPFEHTNPAAWEALSAVRAFAQRLDAAAPSSDERDSALGEKAK